MYTKSTNLQLRLLLKGHHRRLARRLCGFRPSVGLPLVSIVVPFFGLTNSILRILKGNPTKELQWRLQVVFRPSFNEQGNTRGRFPHIASGLELFRGLLSAKRVISVKIQNFAAPLLELPTPRPRPQTSNVEGSLG